MTWTRQVAHVVGKDLRQWTLMYAIYIVIVVIATLHGIGLFVGVTVFEASVPFVILAAMLLVVVAVQGDSATRADAFWASRPLQPSAVAGAKVVQALLLIAIALIGQTVAMLSRGMEAVTLASYLLPGRSSSACRWPRSTTATRNHRPQYES